VTRAVACTKALYRTRRPQITCGSCMNQSTIEIVTTCLYTKDNIKRRAASWMWMVGSIHRFMNEPISWFCCLRNVGLLVIIDSCYESVHVMISYCEYKTAIYCYKFKFPCKLWKIMFTKCIIERKTSSSINIKRKNTQR